MSDQADSQGVQADVSTDSPAAAPDPMSARFDELKASIESLRAPAPEAQEQGYNLQDLATDPYSVEDDAQGFDPYEGYEEQPDPNAEAQAQQWLQQQIQDQVQQGIHQAVTPMRIQQQAAQLEQKYPELQKPEVAGRVVQAARQMAERVGRSNNFSPQQIDAMSRDPQLVEQMYLAERGARSAAQETPADGGIGAHLEGASAQVDAPEEDFMDRLVQSGTTNKFWTGG